MFLVSFCWAKLTDSSRPLRRCSTRERSADCGKPSPKEPDRRPKINAASTVERIVCCCRVKLQRCLRVVNRFCDLRLMRYLIEGRFAGEAETPNLPCNLVRSYQNWNAHGGEK